MNKIPDNLQCAKVEIINHSYSKNNIINYYTHYINMSINVFNRGECQLSFLSTDTELMKRDEAYRYFNRILSANMQDHTICDLVYMHNAHIEHIKKENYKITILPFKDLPKKAKSLFRKFEKHDFNFQLEAIDFHFNILLKTNK